MNEGIIQKIIRRQNLNILIASILGLAVVAALAVFNLSYWINFVSGPAAVDNAALLAAKSPADLPRPWVTVKGMDLLDTGIQYISTSSGGAKTVEASYYALVLDSKVMIVKMAGEPAASELVTTLTGWLTELTSEEDAEIIQKSVADTPELKDLILPFKLDTSDYRTNGYLGLAVGGVVVLACLWGLFTVLRRMGDPGSHPILKKLARFGPLDFIVPRIEADLAAPHPVDGKVHLGNSWLVYLESANLLASRYEDVVWVYKHVLTNKSYGITVGKTYTMIVNDRFGERLYFKIGPKEPACDVLLRAVLERAPWAVAGYSAELEQAWRKDRPGFLAEVDRRRAEARQL